MEHPGVVASSNIQTLQIYKNSFVVERGKGEVCATAGLLSNSFVYNGDKKSSTLTLALDM
jgi:hypothetical protein